MSKYFTRKPTPREHITHHDDNPEERHYVGKVTGAILQARFYQLMINWDPNMTDKKEAYLKKIKETVQGLKKLKILTSILTKYQGQMDREFFQEVKKFQ